MPWPAVIETNKTAPQITHSFPHLEARPTPADFLRASTVALTGLALLLTAFTLWWAGSGTLLANFGGDNAIYFLTANHYSPYGLAHPAAAEFAANSIYPPLYPWLLAVAGGGSSLAAAHRVTALIILLVGCAVYGFARAVGLSRAEAAAIVVLSALARISLLEGLDLHSEHLYLALWLAAAMLLANDAPRGRAVVLAALAIGAAYLTRSFGITMVASFVLWLLLRRPPRAWLAVVLVALPVVYLVVSHHGNARYTQDFLELYQRVGVVARLEANLRAVLPSWQNVFGDLDLAGFQPLLPVAVALLASLGLATRLRRGCFDSLSVPAYGVLMIIWPYPAEYVRMFYPLLPFALIYAVLGVRALVPGVAGRYSAALPMLLSLAAVAPFALLVQARLLAPPADPLLGPYLRSGPWFDADPAAAFVMLGYQRAITEALVDIGKPRKLPPKACLVSTKPAVAALYSGLSAEAYPPFAPGDDELREHLMNGRCRYLFIMMNASPKFPQQYYPYQRLRPWLQVIEIFPNPLKHEQPAAMLARVREQALGTEDTDMEPAKAAGPGAKANMPNVAVPSD